MAHQMIQFAYQVGDFMAPKPAARPAAKFISKAPVVSAAPTSRPRHVVCRSVVQPSEDCEPSTVMPAAEE
eukprot:s312_g14.t1